MKRLLFLTVLFCSPVFADELPVLWLTAGQERAMYFDEPEGHWILHHEHRVLNSGTIREMQMHVSWQPEPRVSNFTSFKTPPLNPGLQLRAEFLVDNVPKYKVIIAASDPFEDRKKWFDEHPIALYDPEKTTVELFEEEEIPFKRLRSFADIESAKNTVIVIGEATDFDRERGLAELLFEKAAQDGSILVIAPKGDIPLVFSSPIRSLLMTESPKHIFPDVSDRTKWETWALDVVSNQVVLTDAPPGGATVMDIHFPNGRIIFDRVRTVSQWKELKRVEAPWYFKSLIETLTNE